MQLHADRREAVLLGRPPPLPPPLPPPQALSCRGCFLSAQALPSPRCRFTSESSAPCSSRRRRPMRRRQRMRRCSSGSIRWSATRRRMVRAAAAAAGVGVGVGVW